MYGLSQFVGILSALVFVVSADAYRTKPQIPRHYVHVLLPILIWFALAPIPLGARVVHAPGHLMIAACLTAAGLAYVSLTRHTRLLGAAVVGAAMILLAGANASWAFSAQGSSGLPDRFTFLNLALYLAMALGMQLMTFEDMTYELRVTNRRLESAQDELRELVTRDALTGCRNRRFFDEVINQEIQRHRRYGIPLSLLFIDVNRFKVDQRQPRTRGRRPRAQARRRIPGTQRARSGLRLPVGRGRVPDPDFMPAGVSRA